MNFLRVNPSIQTLVYLNLLWSRVLSSIYLCYLDSTEVFWPKPSAHFHIRMSHTPPFGSPPLITYICVPNTLLSTRASSSIPPETISPTSSTGRPPIKSAFFSRLLHPFLPPYRPFKHPFRYISYVVFQLFQSVFTHSIRWKWGYGNWERWAGWVEDIRHLLDSQLEAARFIRLDDRNIRSLRCWLLMVLCGIPSRSKRRSVSSSYQKLETSHFSLFVTRPACFPSDFQTSSPLPYVLDFPAISPNRQLSITQLAHLSPYSPRFHVVIPAIWSLLD